MSSVINGFIVFSLVITLVYLFGLLAFISDHEENKCEMTYMFEYPQFVRIFNEIDDEYAKYGLYAYSEGRQTEKTRDMYFNGIPVLFIPGNGGSHRQVRSLASVALRKAYNSRTPFHFDYFTIDLNHELSGLNGALLFEQLNYVNRSIYKILELYKRVDKQPKSVVLVGHSMGGLIARKIVADLPPDSDLIPLVLTLATPHKRPSLILDSYLNEFYQNIDDTSIVPTTTIVSLSGGYSDFLVPVYQTTTATSGGRSLNVVTTHIPRSWLAADHLCILWCKQTILAVNRALFDSVDVSFGRLTNDSQRLLQIFHHHLVHNNGIKIHAHPSIARNQGEWIERLDRRYTIDLPKGTPTTHFYMVRLLDQPQHEMLTVVALNLETVEWAFVCGAHTPRGGARVCDSFTALSQRSEIAPSATAFVKRRTLTVNLHELLKRNASEKYTHVVLRVLPTDDPVVLNIDVYGAGERKTTMNLPSLFVAGNHMVIDETPERALTYDVSVPDLTHVIQSFKLDVEPIQCTNAIREATASLIVPWAHHNIHKHFTEKDTEPFHLRLYESRPQWASHQVAVVRLTLSPHCRYRVTIRSSISGTLSNFARYYTPLLLANAAAVILMTFTAQLKSLALRRQCSSCFVALCTGAKPYYVLTAVKLISRLLGALAATPLFWLQPDWSILATEGMDFFVLPLVLYVASVGLVWMAAVGLAVALVVYETTVHKWALKFLARTVSFTMTWSDYLMAAIHKIPFVVALGLVLLSITTTGGLALLVGLIFYFMKLTQMSQDYIEALVWNYMKKIGNSLKKKKADGADKDGGNHNEVQYDLDAHNAIYFHATLFFIWSLVTFINLPSVLTWAHNYKFSTVLNPDPAFIPGLILSACALPLWQLDMPKVDKKYYEVIARLVVFFAVASLIFAPISTYRLNYTLTGVILMVTLHQTSAPNRDGAEQEREGEEHLSYDTVKAKLH